MTPALEAAIKPQKALTDSLKAIYKFNGLNKTLEDTVKLGDVVKNNMSTMKDINKLTKASMSITGNFYASRSLSSFYFVISINSPRLMRSSKLADFLKRFPPS